MFIVKYSFKKYKNDLKSKSKKKLLKNMKLHKLMN